MYIVITYNQASGQPDLATYGIYTDLQAAQDERDDQRTQTAAVGRGERHVVAEVVPMEDDDA